MSEVNVRHFRAFVQAQQAKTKSNPSQALTATEADTVCTAFIQYLDEELREIEKVKGRLEHLYDSIEKQKALQRKQELVYDQLSKDLSDVDRKEIEVVADKVEDDLSKLSDKVYAKTELFPLANSFCRKRNMLFKCMKKVFQKESITYTDIARACTQYINQPVETDTNPTVEDLIDVSKNVQAWNTYFGDINILPTNERKEDTTSFFASTSVSMSHPEAVYVDTTLAAPVTSAGGDNGPIRSTKGKGPINTGGAQKPKRKHSGKTQKERKDYYSYPDNQPLGPSTMPLHRVKKKYRTEEDRRVERRKSPAYGPTRLAKEIAQTPDKYLLLPALKAKRQMAKNDLDVKQATRENIDGLTEKRDTYKKDINIEIKGRIWWNSWSRETGYYNPEYTGLE